MKDLRTYIKESLLDVDDNDAKLDDVVELEALRDPKGPFAADWMRLAGTKVDIQNDFLILHGNRTITPSRVIKPLSEYKVTQTKLYFPGSVLDCKFEVPITDEHLGKDVYCRGIDISCGSISNVNFHLSEHPPKGVDASSYMKSARTPYALLGAYRKIQNVSINYEGSNGILKLICLPNLVENISSNAASLYIYDTFLWDELFSDIDKHWMDNFEFEYHENGTDKIIKSNKFRKLKAIVNNPRKYNSQWIKFPFKPTAKVSDILPWIKNMSNLRYICMRDNNVAIHFYKHQNEIPSSFNLYTETQDGWWGKIEIYK